MCGLHWVSEDLTDQACFQQESSTDVILSECFKSSTDVKPHHVFTAQRSLHITVDLYMWYKESVQSL